MGGGGRIAGWAVADDATARDLQRTEPQWTRAKAFDTSCPWGPWVTTIDELPDARGLRIGSWVNGEQRQDSTTDDLIFGPAEIVEFMLRDLHARARRPDPHRHPRGRRRRDGPADLRDRPATSCGSRSSGSGRSSTKCVNAPG